MLILAITSIIIATFFLVIKLFLVTKTTKINLKGKHVLITGGSSGIGRSLAKEALKEGANITLIARRHDVLKEAEDYLLSSCPKASIEQIQLITLDITAAYPRVQEAIISAEKKFGTVDVLVNSAGYSRPSTFEQLEIQHFKNMMDVNFMGTVQVTKAVMGGMRKKYGAQCGDGGRCEDEGRVVLVSSQAGQVGLYGFTAYSPTKFALRGFAESLQMELLDSRVRVCIAYPPDTDTPGFEEEDKHKPRLTRLLSETSGLFSADHVASTIMTGVKNGDFNISIGFDGFFLSHLTAGMSPANNVFQAAIQILTGGMLRVVALFHAKKFEKMILHESRHENKHK